MKRFFLFSVMAMVLSLSSAALALDNGALLGKWKLVDRAKDSEGKPCPFVGAQIEFTPDGRMISPNMPVIFHYKVNPDKADAAAAIAKSPELEGMEIMLAAMGNGQIDWSKAPIVYGIQLKDNQLYMKVAGYTLSRYKKVK